jgi:hypothetical protein
MLRHALRFLIVLPLLAGLIGCTITGAERQATKDLHWFGLRSHTDLAANSRWQFTPDTRVRIAESHAASDRAWLHAAEEGFYSVFESPDENVDLVLLISWPEVHRASEDEQSGWRFLPEPSDPLDVTLKLITADDRRVVQTAKMRVDPSWFSGLSQRPAQIQASFQRYAESLTARR